MGKPPISIRSHTARPGLADRRGNGRCIVPFTDAGLVPGASTADGNIVIIRHGLSLPCCMPPTIGAPGRYVSIT